MKQILSRNRTVWVILILFCAGILLLYAQLGIQEEKWVAYPTNRHLYTEGHLQKGGMITDRNGIVLCQTVDGVRTFHEDETIRKATAHAVGDLDGFVATGIHSAFFKELTGYDRLNGVYGEGNDVELTIDANLSAVAYNALGDHAGAVGVYNYKTGEILCMASTPTFDPAVHEKSQEKGVYVNRLLSGSYAPGSIFKVVTAFAALEHLKNAKEQTFSCRRGVTIEGEWLSCLGDHGTIPLENALVHSCNAVFSQFALAVGKENLTKTAEHIGFNQTLTVNDIDCTPSVYNVEIANQINFGWSGIGQYTDTVNPFQFLTFMGGIAGGGTCVWPYFVKNIGGHPQNNRKTVDMMAEDTAAALTQMMRKAVTDNYGDSRFPGLSLCAKTGTAEVGDQGTPHSWFVGFNEDQTKPYAFVVVVEHAGSGLGTASAIASKVLQEAPTV